VDVPTTSSSCLFFFQVTVIIARDWYLFFFPRRKTEKVLLGSAQRIGVTTNCGAEGQRLELP